MKGIPATRGRREWHVTGHGGRKQGCQDEAMDSDARGRAKPRRGRVRPLAAVLVGIALVWWVLEGRLTPDGDDERVTASASVRPSSDVFDADRAWTHLRRQVALGPRPAGSPAARRLAEYLLRRLPAGRIESVRGGLANVVGTVPGTRPAVVIGAHYDTKDLGGFVGANDGASGTAVVMELARALARARRPAGAPELRFVLFDGEEATNDMADFLLSGARGSRAYSARHRGEIGAMVLLDMVGDERLRIPREASSDAALWRRLRAAARSAGTLGAFPASSRPTILDDHTPFLRAGIPAIDIIDFEFACWHRTCDDLDAVSPRSLDVVGETVAEMLVSWRWR